MAMVVLPQDIVEDILSRLPVKSLQKLRCMSKSCDFLISTQSFARMHMQRAIQSPKSSSEKILLFPGFRGPKYALDYEKDQSFADDGAISRLDFPVKTPHDDSSIRVVGTCHGLLCLAMDHNKDSYFLWDFCLWNPSTGEYKILPDPYCLLPEDKGGGCSFAYGFGYDSFSDDFKVLFGLRLWWSSKVPGSRTDYEENKVVIFSMRENCWRIIPELPPDYTQFFHYCPDYGSFVDGFLNWLYKKPEKLVAFDLKTERFFELPLPDAVSPCLCASLGVLEGRLCLSVVNYYDANQPFSSSYLVELWVRNEYGVGQSWTRLLNAPLEASYWHQSPLCISKDNQIILANEHYKKNRLTRFDAEGRKSGERKICKCGIHVVHPFHRPCQAVPYLEGLISPNIKNTL